MNLENELRETLEKSEIPARMHDGIIRYIVNRTSPGGFLQSIICNNLTEVCMCADDKNITLLPQYVRWFYNYAPAACWGSKLKMEAWVGSV